MKVVSFEVQKEVKTSHTSTINAIQKIDPSVYNDHNSRIVTFSYDATATVFNIDSLKTEAKSPYMAELLDGILYGGNKILMEGKNGGELNVREIPSMEVRKVINGAYSGSVEGYVQMNDRIIGMHFDEASFFDCETETVMWYGGSSERTFGDCKFSHMCSSLKNRKIGYLLKRERGKLYAIEIISLDRFQKKKCFKNRKCNTPRTAQIATALVRGEELIIVFHKTIDVWSAEGSLIHEIEKFNLREFSKSDNFSSSINILPVGVNRSVLVLLSQTSGEILEVSLLSASVRKVEVIGVFNGAKSVEWINTETGRVVFCPKGGKLTVAKFLVKGETEEDEKERIDFLHETVEDEDNKIVKELKITLENQEMKILQLLFLL